MKTLLPAFLLIAFLFILANVALSEGNRRNLIDVKERIKAQQVIQEELRTDLEMLLNAQN